MPVTINLFLLIALLILSGVLSAAEASFISLNYHLHRISYLAKQGNVFASKLEGWLKEPDPLLTFLLIFNDVLNLFIPFVSTLIGLQLGGEAGAVLAVSITTCASIIFSDLLPKSIATKHAQSCAFITLRLLAPLFTLTYPIVLLIHQFTSVCVRGCFKLLQLGDGKEAVTTHLWGKEEMLSLLNAPNTPLPVYHKSLLKSVLTMEEVLVREVMTPRREMEALDLNLPLPEFIEKLKQSYHKYIVLYQENTDCILGLLNTQMVQRLLFKGKILNPHFIEGLLEPMYCIPEFTPLHAQLLEFRNRELEIGFVVDEYGYILGLITMADILEETLVNLPRIRSLTQTQKDGSVVASGSMYVRNLNQKFGWSLPTKGPRTLNGLILEQLSELPEIHTRLKIGHLQLTILDVRDNRVKWVQLQPQALPN